MKLRYPSLKGHAMIFLSALGYGSYGLWAKLIGDNFGVFSQGWIRSMIILAILVPIALATHSFKPVARKDIKWILAAVFFGILIQAPLYYAYTHTDIGTATVVFYAFLLIASYAVGKLALGERIGGSKIAALLLAIVGMAIVFGFSVDEFSLLALIFAGIGGIASGCEVSLTKKVTGTLTSLQMVIYIGVGIVLTHLPLAFWLRETVALPALDMVWFGMAGFVGAGILAFWLAIEGYRYVDASIGGLIGLLEILFAVGIGVLLFNEHLTRTVLIGGGLIMLAAMLPDIVLLGRNHRYKRRLAALSVDRPL